ncbi:MAG: deoxyribonuclease IV [Spirochaetota bacterium]|nr:deoxyribonuclease IV [Spirochaetota bacterium]
MRYIGVHVSVAGGLYKSLMRAKILGINAIQIFLKNARRWENPPYKNEDVELFKINRRKFDDLQVFAHSGYLINLAAKGNIFLKSFRAMIDEIERADALGIDYIVLHPGNHKGNGEVFAIDKIANSLRRIIQRIDNKSIKILLETTSGSGTTIGYRFEHLRDIIDISKNSERISVCLDTCHIFAAGYRISDEEGFHRTIEEFDRIIGLDRLKLIHLNDCKSQLGSKIDRHEHIGEGFIGDSGFRLILNDNRLKDIPMILETPKVIRASEEKSSFKDIPKVIETSRKYGLSIVDVLLKDMPTVYETTKRIGVSASDAIFKNLLNTIDNAKRFGVSIFDTILKDIPKSLEVTQREGVSIPNVLLKDIPKILETSIKRDIPISDAVLKNIVNIYEKAKLSLFEVDGMNLNRVYGLIDNNK